MKSLNLKLVFSIAGLWLFVSVSAQSFHYDTIPNPVNNQRQLYRYEIQNRLPTEQKQQPPTPSKQSELDKNRLIFGGSFGLSFGNDYTSVNIAPQVGYRFSKHFTSGAGLSYIYYNTNNWAQNYFGPNLYAQVNPTQNIVLRIQPEIYMIWGSDGFNNSINKTAPCLLIGGGAILPAGKKGGVSMMLYYDLIQNDHSPYRKQLVYSIGYVFSF